MPSQGEDAQDERHDRIAVQRYRPDTSADISQDDGSLWTVGFEDTIFCADSKLKPSVLKPEE